MATDFFRVVTDPGDPAVTVVEVALPSHLDSDEFDRINESLLDVFAGRAGGRWVIDLSAMSYMGSSVLGLMVNIRQKVKAGGGHLALCGLSPRLLSVFRTCCLERLFTIKNARADAVYAVGE